MNVSLSPPYVVTSSTVFYLIGNVLRDGFRFWSLSKNLIGQEC